MENLQSSLGRDCTLILEAIRRLKEGTWQLKNEDSDWTDHLLPKVREALLDHIEFEDNAIVPGLPTKLAAAHVADHNIILALIWAIDRSSQMKEANHFHALLELLTKTLEHHHVNFGCNVPALELSGEAMAQNRIINRAENANLEGK